MLSNGRLEVGTAVNSPQHLTRTLTLNGFEVVLPTTVDVVLRSMPSPSDVAAERERLAGYWFVHWVGGVLYCLRLKGGGPNVAGEPKPLKVSDHPWMFRARLRGKSGSNVALCRCATEIGVTRLTLGDTIIELTCGSAETSASLGLSPTQWSNIHHLPLPVAPHADSTLQARETAMLAVTEGAFACIAVHCSEPNTIEDLPTDTARHPDLTGDLRRVSVGLVIVAQV
jgi:hypothetical protein